MTNKHKDLESEEYESVEELQHKDKVQIRKLKNIRESKTSKLRKKPKRKTDDKS